MQFIRNPEMDNQINDTNVMQLAKFRPHLYGISDPVSSSKKLQGNNQKTENGMRLTNYEPITMQGFYQDPDSSNL